MYIYSDKVFREHNEVLPEECRLALIWLDVEEARKHNDNGKAIELLKDAVNVYEPFNEIIKLYVQKLGENIKEEKNTQDVECESDEIKEELAQLAIVLKLKAREFIENGAVEEAKVVLGQIIQCVPEDEEAKEILSMIE